MGILNWFIHKKPKTKKIDVDKDIRAISFFFTEVHGDMKRIMDLIEKFTELREKEKHLLLKHGSSEGLRFNTEKQAKVMDELLELYEDFDGDVDVNGERVKIIGRDLKKKSKKRKISQHILDRMNGKVEGVDWWVYNW